MRKAVARRRFGDLTVEILEDGAVTFGPEGKQLLLDRRNTADCDMLRSAILDFEEDIGHPEPGAMGLLVSGGKVKRIVPVARASDLEGYWERLDAHWDNERTKGRDAVSRWIPFELLDRGKL